MRGIWKRAGLSALLMTGAVALGACGDEDGAAAPAKLPRLGFVSASASPPFIEALKEGLAELGYVDGKNMELELHATKVEAELPAIAKQLVADKVDLIIAGGTKAIEAAMAETTTIPIVMTNSGNPAETGLVDSMERPGHNVTGLSQSSPALAPKRLELIKESFPGTRKVALMVNLTHPSVRLSVGELEAAAPKLGMTVFNVPFTGSEDIKAGLKRAKQKGAQAVLVLRDPETVNKAEEIAKAAVAIKLPAMYESRNFLEAGGLMLYGPSFATLYKRSARYIDKVLKGADPATLPIEQPTGFELVINMKAADELGVEIPEQVRLRAEEL